MQFYFKNNQNGFFRGVIYVICSFVQSCLISCLVQLLDLTFHEISHFRKKYIFFWSLLFLIYRRLTLHFTVFFYHTPLPAVYRQHPLPSLPFPSFPVKSLRGRGDDDFTDNTPFPVYPSPVSQ